MTANYKWSIRPADIPGQGLRYDYDDGNGLVLQGFARSERAAMRAMRRRVRLWQKQKAALDD